MTKDDKSVKSELDGEWKHEISEEMEIKYGDGVLEYFAELMIKSIVSD